MPGLGLGLGLGRGRGHGSTGALADQPTTSMSSFTLLGVDVLLTESDGTTPKNYDVGTYVDGVSYFIVAPTGDVTIDAQINAGESSDTGIGDAMIDPPDLMTQGWDNRVNGSGLGPGLIYDGARAVTLPATITPTTKPITILISRLVDTVPTGGAQSGMAAIIAVTICKSNPGEDPIRPSCLDGAKTQLNASDINTSLFTPKAIPGGATEPTWDVTKSYHKHGLFRTGHYGALAQISVCDPGYTQQTYPADQVPYTAEALVAALSDSASADLLKYNLVRDGLQIYDQVLANLADPSKAFANSGGGFGYGLDVVMFAAGKWAGLSALVGAADLTYANTYVSQTITMFGEPGMCFFGVTDSEYPNSPGKPLYGTKPYLADCSGGGNSDNGDTNGVREPWWGLILDGTAAVVSGTAQHDRSWC